MKFLVDAHLPRRLVRWMAAQGHDVIHTLDLPQQNSTTDSEINRISTDQERVVISKDSDFVDSFLLGKGPYKLLLISTGNITNTELIASFERNFDQINETLASNNYIELDRTAIIVHS